MLTLQYSEKCFHWLDWVIFSEIECKLISTELLSMSCPTHQNISIKDLLFEHVLPFVFIKEEEDTQAR